eukprot:CAMPEP_0178967868 /NCGR_PEP_ID=MMETSP0789-20121207/17875_1 /TAXON_ID=3005 /ORGANISM="Rhizosolenia setigera, Strain CCMP 1694" /LENGTH=135 /DNA_ID=CAMNT_0020653609 /DNA_START=299 /DNA_END=706 /DNA_ORIENTATION=-
MEASYGQTSLKRMTYSIAFKGLNIDCRFRWSYDYGVKGNGRGTIETSSNNLKTTIVAVSYNFYKYPANITSQDDCEAKVNVENMNFNGGLSGLVANTLEGFFRDDVSESVRKALCDELSKVGKDQVQDFIVNLSD